MSAAAIVLCRCRGRAGLGAVGEQGGAVGGDAGLRLVVERAGNRVVGQLMDDELVSNARRSVNWPATSWGRMMDQQSSLETV